MSRWRASGIHILISFSVAALFLAVLLVLWYPEPYFRASGADTLVLLVLGVDVTLGPLLTLIVFDIKKSRTKLIIDLSVIAVLQLSAMTYGIHTAWNARPVFMAFAIDRFILVAANELLPQDIAAASKAEFKELSWKGPTPVIAHRPTDDKEREAILFNAISGGNDIERLPKYYVDYQSHSSEIIPKLQSIDSLKGNHNIVAHNIINAKQLRPEDVGYVPLQARVSDMAVLVERKTGNIITAIDLGAAE